MPKEKVIHVKDCPVCFLPCDPEIHQASVDLHSWLRKRMKIVIKTSEED